MTYGDGVADLDIQATIAFHKSHGKLVTLTSVQPVARFGALGIKNNSVYAFQEKPNGRRRMDQRRLLRAVAESDRRDQGRPLDVRAPAHRSPRRKGEVQAYPHHGFWQAMDTLREKTQLEELWASGKAPWKTW